MIEKFGVPPDKVIEVQSLIGDSTDNVPGVPGIGVKTAAQLIDEYGDLETLLKRAGEIKQQKRRQTLIDNADKARLSKRLVTLDDKVKLDVPLADLAVHEPDYKLLIAFLKAMEFNTLTRRVAEFSGIEAAEIEASANAVHARRRATGRRTQRRGRAKPWPRRVHRHPPGLPLSGGGMAPKPRPTGARRAPIEITPQALAAERTEAARKAKFDRSRYEIVSSRDRLKAWVARARDLGVVAINAETRRRRPDAGGAVRHRARGRAQRGLLRAARASQGGNGDGGLFGGGLAPDQIARSRRARRAQAAARRPGRAQDRPEPQIRLAALRRARHRDALASTTPC